jgi:hypothetical protein
MHFLLADPYIRYFAADWAVKGMLKHDLRRLVPTSLLKKRYTIGCLVMDILARRYRKRNDSDQSIFDDHMKLYFAELREKVHIEYDGYGFRRGMGDISTLMNAVLPALRFFIALQWSGHPVQRHYLANGLNPLFAFQQRCPSHTALCPLAQKEHIGFDVDGRMLQLKDMTDTDVITIKEEREDIRSIHLEQWCTENLVKSKWKLAEHPSCKAGVCNSRRLEKRSLATLPWMLYINKAVPGHIPIIYDPEKLVFGPTVDNKYAVYKLIARDIFAYAHFSADIRIKGRLFANWSFEHKKDFIIPEGLQVDRNCSFMIWQRVE